MPSIGPLELAIVLLIVILIFGPKRLPSIGRSLGHGMREFKESITGSSKDEDDDEEKAQLPAAQAEPTATTTPAEPPVAAEQDRSGRSA